MLVETQKAKDSLNEIEACHHDIIKLESSLRDLHGMFGDLAMLVTNQVSRSLARCIDRSSRFQGHMVDCIEDRVSKAANYVQVSTVGTKAAAENQVKATKVTQADRTTFVPSSSFDSLEKDFSLHSTRHDRRRYFLHSLGGLHHSVSVVDRYLCAAQTSMFLSIS